MDTVNFFKKYTINLTYIFLQYEILLRYFRIEQLNFNTLA